MNPGLTFIGGAGLGAGAMYLLDPAMGRQRRALMRDQLVRMLSTSGPAMGAQVRYLRNQARGVAAEPRSRAGSVNVADAVLAARVRSRLAQVTPHADTIDVTARQGFVTLAGSVPAAEVDRLLAQVSAVPGVTGVENRMQVHAGAGEISRQGAEHRTVLRQDRWPLRARLLTGLAAISVMAYGIARRDRAGAALGTLGAGLLVRDLVAFLPNYRPGQEGWGVSHIGRRAS
jgi:osmotically-inducible protein OsmY